MKTIKRFGTGPLTSCQTPDRSAVCAHSARRRPLPVLAIATLEAAPAQREGTGTPAAPSRAVVIGGSVAGLLTAAVAAPFFDEVWTSWHAPFSSTAPVEGI